ncbi:helix-turn-helix domain-containing protein [Streptomyces sp. NPDC048636]|uniref:helix-turn-helix domain-containing protein n=1 Tax=Streptomyces sp. NPDC048636 TaxID=3155762 RepID=UPI003413941E
MTPSRGRPLSFSELFDLPLVLDVRTTARVFGVCPDTMYRQIRRGRLSFPVHRLGWQYRIPTAPMLRSLGIEELPVYAADVEAGAAHARTHPPTPS